MTLDKTFQPQKYEDNIYRDWENAGAFSADPTGGKEPFTIMMPPPNVTGSLHIGHGLTMTLQDILTRYHRMKGKDALWQPGTDHAGIATQMVVERQLDAEGVNRRDLGREKFVEKVWDWKAQSGGRIIEQLRALGASADWSRERFTMDDGLSKAVKKAFVKLHKDGLIYKDKRLVNWDPKLLTAISDLEVVHKEVKGKLYHFRYPYEDGSGYLVIATTRPETILADGAVAVHPDDERYKDMVGKFVVVPIVNRIIPIIADDFVDPEFGSGAVKITAAHDYNDFEFYKRHEDRNIALINLFTPDAKMNENFPEEYQGLDRFEARKKVVADFDEMDYLEGIEEITHQVPYGDRSDVPVEPYLMDQWYVDAKTLAQPAIEAVNKGETVFTPKQWENTFYRWMEDIQPWCISRQLWWGHRIPAWYGEDGHVFVAESEEEAYEQARSHYGKTDISLSQDEDVLDTWFSSGLWPFSTLGWPERTEALEKYYPGDVLITGFDIIFFWVARMMMFGHYFMGEAPFKTVYMHALVRDAKGQKMSKSKGNVMDPLDIVERYGADAMRFTLAAMASPGRDIKLSESRIEGYRNFGTKLWNAARYCEMKSCTPPESFDVNAIELPLNQWIIDQLAQTQNKLDKAFANYRFDEIAEILYHFVWNVFCDWYLEFTKPLLNEERLGSAEAKETQATIGWVLQQILVLLNPVMPYITESLNKEFHGAGRRLLITSAWPDLQVDYAAARNEVETLMALIMEIRSTRADMNVPAGQTVPLLMKTGSDDMLTLVRRYEEVIKMMAKASPIEAVDSDFPKGAIQMVIKDSEFAMPIADIIDLDQERDRLKKQISKLEADLKKIEGKLGNEKFLANAPEDVVEEQKSRQDEISRTLKKFSDALSQIEAA